MLYLLYFEYFAGYMRYSSSLSQLVRSFAAADARSDLHKKSFKCSSIVCGPAACITHAVELVSRPGVQPQNEVSCSFAMPFVQ